MGVPPSLCIIMQSPLVACVVFLAGACLSNPLPEDTESQNAGLSMRLATPPPIRRSAQLAMNSSVQQSVNNSVAPAMRPATRRIMRQSAPHRMRNSAPLATPPATSRSVPLVDTISEMLVDMDARSPARTFLFRSPLRAALQFPRRTVSKWRCRDLYRNQCRTVLRFPRNPVNLFLNRTVPLSLYRHLPR